MPPSCLGTAVGNYIIAAHQLRELSELGQREVLTRWVTRYEHIANCSSNNFVVADTDDYARVALPAAAAVAPSAAAAASEGDGLSDESNNESGSDDMESVIESEQGVIV